MAKNSKYIYRQTNSHVAGCMYEDNLYFHKTSPPTTFTSFPLRNILHFPRPSPFSPPTPSITYYPLVEPLHLLLLFSSSLTRPTLRRSRHLQTPLRKNPSHWHHISLFISISPSADFHLLTMLWSIKSVRCSSLQVKEEDEERRRNT